MSNLLNVNKCEHNRRGGGAKGVKGGTRKHKEGVDIKMAEVSVIVLGVYKLFCVDFIPLLYN